MGINIQKWYDTAGSGGFLEVWLEIWAGYKTNDHPDDVVVVDFYSTDGNEYDTSFEMDPEEAVNLAVRLMLEASETVDRGEK